MGGARAEVCCVCVCLSVSLHAVTPAVCCASLPASAQHYSTHTPNSTRPQHTPTTTSQQHTRPQHKLPGASLTSAVRVR